MQGRITFCVMLFVRFLCSTFSEYGRQRWLKGIFLDKRDTVKIFAITRYFFTSLVLVPGMTLCNRYFEFKGTMIAIISAILVFQEVIVFIMIGYKIRKANPPPKMLFLDRRFGPEIDREIAFMQINIVNSVKVDEMSKQKAGIN
jgi:hypothetical protein